MWVDQKIPQNTGWSINPVTRQVRKRDGSFEYTDLGFAIDLDPERVPGEVPTQVFTKEQALHLAHSIIKAVA